jgi:hypothetical protein
LIFFVDSNFGISAGAIIRCRPSTGSSLLSKTSQT